MKLPITVSLWGKQNCQRSKEFLDKLAIDLKSINPKIQIYRELALVPDINFAVVCGGDGTIIEFASLYPDMIPIPPILPFSFGTLGFLLPFGAPTPRKQILRAVLENKLPILERNRFKVKLKTTQDKEDHKFIHPEYSALNEVLIHRGSTAKVIRLECFLQNKISKTKKTSSNLLLTEAVTDGLLVATPTGSTAYSLSAGGPIVHPEVPAAIITPVCPRSLSFRPIVVPMDKNRQIQLQITERSRNTAMLAVDGRTITEELKHTDQVIVSQHPQPLRMFHGSNLDSEWTSKITNSLGWNSPFKERKTENK